MSRFKDAIIGESGIYESSLSNRVYSPNNPPPSTPMAFGVANTSANNVYLDNSSYFKRVTTVDGFPVNGMLSGVRVGTANAQRLQDETTGKTYARYWINATTSWSAWLMYTDAGDFTAKGDLLLGSGASGFARQAVGADGSLMVADSSQASGVRWTVADEINPGPGDHGAKAWTGDPSVMPLASTVITGGTLYLQRLYLARSATISTIYLTVATAGATLTNAGVALYNSSGTLITGAQAVNTSQATATSWQSTGFKTIALNTPPTIQGYFFVGFWSTGTTLPAMLRGSQSSAINFGQSAPNLRFSTGATALTTTAPATMGTQTASGNAFWVAVS